MTRILVTGATGYVGRQVMAALRAGGHDAVGATREDADLMEQDQVERLLATVRPTHLLHLAWVTAHGAFWTHPDNERWLEASLRLVEEFARQGGRRVVTAGSCTEYSWKGAAPLSEAHTPCEPATPYGQAKLALYRRTAQLCRDRGLSHAHARLFFSYGPGEKPERLVPLVIRSLLGGRPFEISTPDSVRDYLDVRDLGRALVLLTVSDIQGAINVAAGIGVTVRSLAEAIADIAGRGELLSFRSPAPADSVVADTGRLSRELGFAPAIDLRTGLAKAVQWWLQAGNPL